MRATYSPVPDPREVLESLVAFHDRACDRVLPYAAETARLYALTLGSTGQRWRVERDLADRWRKEARNDRPLRTAWGHVPSWEDVTAEAAPTPGPEHLFGALAEQLWAPALRAEVE